MTVWLSGEHGFTYRRNRVTPCLCPKDYWHPKRVMRTPDKWERIGNLKSKCARDWNNFARAEEHVWQGERCWWVAVGHGVMGPGPFRSLRQAIRWAEENRPMAADKAAYALEARAARLRRVEGPHR